MFGQLFVKECRQTAKSLIYWLAVLVLILNFFSQLGGLEIMPEPKKGQEEYGFHYSKDKEVIMEATLGALLEEYYRGNYAAYPIGFYKNVTLSGEETARMEKIIKEATGLDGREEIEKAVDDWYEGQKPNKDQAVMAKNLLCKPAEGLSYDRFAELMDQADDILGGGSNYGEGYREKNASVPMTYEEAMEEYETLIGKDKLSGGYARLFADYMVIFLGIIPVFLAVTRVLRDRRAQITELIYTRKGSSFIIIGSRFLAMLVMLLVPVLALSVIPLTQCVKYGNAVGVPVDLFAFVKYSFGWLTPTIMTALAVGMFLTELTDTAIAVLIQGVWWFVSVFSSIGDLKGGMYGWNLVPRHNTELNWTGYQNGFLQLAANRAFYVILALFLTALTVFIYSQKRKGRLQRRGKILADRKSKFKA